MKRIASREFINKETGKRIIASMYTPRQVDEQTWTCRFVIRGLQRQHRHDAQGVDSLQALFQAIQGIRFYLAESQLPIAMFDGGEVGDYGIYKSLAGFDVAMTRHLEGLVQREITKLVREIVRLRRAKAKKAGRPKRKQRS